MNRTLDWLHSMHRWYIICLMVALHFGMDTTQDDEVQRSVTVLDFIEQAVQERINMESQQIAEMDVHGDARADYEAQLTA